MGPPVVNSGPGEHRPCVRYFSAVVRLITLHFNVCKDELKLVCCAMGKRQGFLWCIFQWKAKSSELLQCVTGLPEGRRYFLMKGLNAKS